MPTLPAHYLPTFHALDPIGTACDYHDDRLWLYAEEGPDHRPDLFGRLYLEIYEKYPGGIVCLNGWITPTRKEAEDFFHDLADRTAQSVSPRPYRLGQACDGTIGACVLAAFKTACDALQLDADALHHAAYGDRGEATPDWNALREFSDWQGGVVLPHRWDDEACAGLESSLHEINWHSLATAFSESRSARL